MTRSHAIRMLLSFEPHSHKELKEITGWEGIRLTKVLQYMETQGHIERENLKCKWNLTSKGLETLKRGIGLEDTSKRVENLEEARQYLGGIKSLLTSSESAAL